MCACSGELGGVRFVGGAAVVVKPVILPKLRRDSDDCAGRGVGYETLGGDPQFGA
jgi:hypothetical protein